MTASGSKSLPAIGFLTITEHPEHGLFGGYLVLNAAARPLEFHCTAPVKANRAQEILYGPTLKPYLYGEQIAQTLYRKGRFQPYLICTDVEPVLELRSHIDVPVIYLPGENSSGHSEKDQSEKGGSQDAACSVRASSTPSPEASARYRLDSASHESPPAPRTGFRLGSFRVVVPPSFADDQQTILHQWDQYGCGLDLEEPFSRIRGAIEEAQRAAR